MVQQEWIEKIRQLFIECLAYPLGAIPEFLVNKQKQAGINKEYFFQFLSGILHEYLALAKRHEQTLYEITGGKVNQIKMLSTQSTTTLSKELLLDLAYLVSTAFTLDVSAPSYTPLQVLSYTESALRFILDKFEKQIQVEKQSKEIKTMCNGPMVAANLIFYTEDRYKQLINEDKEFYLLIHYAIMLPTPAFNYFMFEESFRKLLINSKHPENLKPIAKTMQALGTKISVIWEEKLLSLEEGLSNNIIRAEHYLRFDTVNRTFRDVINERKRIYNPSESLFNYDLAVFATRVANLLGTELLKTNTPLNTPTKSVSFPQIAIACYFLKVSINEKNCIEIAKSYNSDLTSNKLLQYRISKASDLTKLRGNPSANTRHLNNLYAAKQLISGKKNKNALGAITRTITAFETNVDNQT